MSIPPRAVDVSQLVEEAEATIDRCASANALYDYVGALTRRIGFDYVAYYAVDPLQSGNRSVVDAMASTTYPAEWRARYSALGYQDHDPVLRAAGSTRLPFVWGDKQYLNALQGRERRMFDEARAFGIRGGVSVPVHGPSGDSGLLTVSSGETGDALRDIVRQGAPVLHVVAHRMHAAMIERLIPKPAEASAWLTEQERVCLLWTLRGKTAWEIAHILGRSRATVNFHLQKALRKLGATNKSHAAIKALRAGLI